MIEASEIGPDGEVRFNRPPADQRFIEPYSGLYFQISGAGADTFASRSLWDRRLRVSTDHADIRPHLYDSDEFSTPGHAEPIRISERDAILPGSKVRWRFQVAQSRETINDQIHKLGSHYSGASSRSASACSCWRRSRPSRDSGRCGGCGARCPRSARGARLASVRISPPRSAR